MRGNRLVHPGVGAALIGLLTAGWTNDAAAAKPQYTDSGKIVRWADPAVTFVLDPSLDAAVEGLSATAATAAASWSGQAGAPSISSAPAASPRPEGTMPWGFDGVNTVSFDKEGKSQFKGRQLAHTIKSFDPSTGQLLDADIVINGQMPQKILPPDAKPTADMKPIRSDGGDTTPTTDAQLFFDMHHTLTHEFGHSLGLLDDMEQKEATMYALVFPNDAARRTPGDLDLQVIQEAYAEPFGGASEQKAGGCGGASLAPRGERFRSVELLPLAGLAIACVALGRRRNAKLRMLGVSVFVATAVASIPHVAQSQVSAQPSGHASMRVVSTNAVNRAGMFHTALALETQTCRIVSCPKVGAVDVFGGTIGRVTQVLDDNMAPRRGNAVDVTFDNVQRAASTFVPQLFPTHESGSAASIRIVRR